MRCRIKLILYSFCLIGFLFVSISYAQQSDWVKAIDRDGIKVYKRSMPGSPIKEVKSVSYMNVPFDFLINLYDDTSRYEEWCHKCTSIKLIEQVNPKEKIIYYQTNSPWPVADRDSYSYHTKAIDPETKSISYSFKDYSHNYPVEKGKIRITDQNGLWRFTPLENGTVELYYQQYVDIGGNVPKWLVNQLIADVPYHSMKKFRALIKNALSKG